MTTLPLPQRLGPVGIVVAVLYLFTLCAPAQADTVTYLLRNHPGGTAAPPQYGLRLDELRNVTSNHDIFTFDFNDSRSLMYLTFDNSSNTIRIYGSVFGGLDLGSAYDVNNSGLWDVDFTYNLNVTLSGSSLQANENVMNAGFIRAQFGPNSGTNISLVDEAGNFGYSFRFNNTECHRLAGTALPCSTFVGWGWLNHSGQAHVYSSDWLFTGQQVANPIPEPATMMLLGTGLASVAAGIKRRRKAAARVDCKTN